MKMILACDLNGGIGKDNDLLVYIPEDLKTFKEYTNGKTVIMGSNTWKSLRFKLPNRTNVVLSRKGVSELKSGELPDITFSNMNDLENYIATIDDAIIIGGGMMYNYFLDKIDEISLSVINSKFEADTFFPLERIFSLGFKAVEITSKDDEKSGLDFIVYKFMKIKK